MIRDPRSVAVHPVCHDSGCRTYVVIAPETREAAVIDPVLDTLPQTLACLDEHRGDLRYVIDTHAHADHLSGAVALQDRRGGELVFHPEHGFHPEAALEAATRRPTAGERLPFGEHGLVVHHAPGNACDAIVIEAQGAFFTGDTLLIGSVGLKDTGSVDGGAWFDSLQRIFADAPETTVVHPGHDDMGRTMTTLKGERTGNMWLREDDREKFLARIRADDRELRKDRGRVLEVNRQGVQRVPRDLDPAAGLAAPADVAEQKAARDRGRSAPVRALPSAAPHHALIVGLGLLAAAGTILGWVVAPALHGLSLLAGVVLIALGMPALEKRRRRKGAGPGLYYEGPASHRMTNEKQAANG